MVHLNFCRSSPKKRKKEKEKAFEEKKLFEKNVIFLSRMNSIKKTLY